MPRPYTSSAKQRRPISAKRKQQNREAQRTFREKKKKLRALQHLAPETKSAAERVSKDQKVSQIQPSQEEDVATATIAPSLPNVLQVIPWQDGSTNLLVSSPPSSNDRYQSEQPMRDRGTFTSAGFTPEPTTITLQYPSDGPPYNGGSWKADLDNNNNNLNETMPVDYKADFATLSSSTDYNNISEVWTFLSAQPAGLPSTQPFRPSTPIIISSGDGAITALSATAASGKEQKSLYGAHGSVFRSMSSQYGSSWELSSSPADFAENTSSGITKQRMSADYTGVLDMLQLLHINQDEENKALLKSALSQDHSIGDIFLAGLQVLGGPPQCTQFNTIPALSDAHAICLNLCHMNIYHAFFTNAVALHFPVDKLIGSDSVSPFYRPEAKTTEALRSIMDVIPDSLPRDLRPTLPQVSHEHSPFLDLLPFPMLRARAILFATCTPPIIDLVELKNDIINGGLTCWNGGHKGSGQPWDMRSWEAAPWFLDKWKVLVGDANDEIWSQTLWWKQLREDHSSVRS